MVAYKSGLCGSGVCIAIVMLAVVYNIWCLQ